MAHEIDTTTGRAAAFFAKEAAWHRLGTVVSEAQTSAEAIKLAGLDWSVDVRGLLASIPFNGDRPTLVDVPSHFATVRSDTNKVLGVVGGYYRPFQNRNAFDFMDTIVQDKLAMFETAGSLKEGRRVWMLARLPGELRAAGDDIIKPYVLLTNSHDGTTALRMIPTSVRVVCWNTLNLALGRAAAHEGLSIVHTESLERRVQEARAKLGIITRRVDEFGTQVQALAKRSMKGDELRDYFTGLVNGRSEKQQGKLLDAFLTNLHNERNNLKGIEGSAWAAYNAVSEWADHQMTVHGQGDAKLDNRVNSIWFGSANRFKQEAFQAALSLAS